ncbi:MAG: LysR family transcriptional regulator, partial [Burkholderiales bacterium]
MLSYFHRLDLNLLRVLVAIDRCRSVTEAGRRLALSQPATSNALARLREAFDDPLFVRGAGGLMPTPLAERIVPVVAQHLESLEAALTEPDAFDPMSSSADWRLSLSDLGEMVFLPSIADAVLREAPHTRLTNVAVPAERVADA